MLSGVCSQTNLVPESVVAGGDQDLVLLATNLVDGIAEVLSDVELPLGSSRRRGERRAGAVCRRGVRKRRARLGSAIEVCSRVQCECRQEIPKVLKERTLLTIRQVRGASAEPHPCAAFRLQSPD